MLLRCSCTVNVELCFHWARASPWNGVRLRSWEAESWWVGDAYLCLSCWRGRTTLRINIYNLIPVVTSFLNKIGDERPRRRTHSSSDFQAVRILAFALTLHFHVDRVAAVGFVQCKQQKKRKLLLPLLFSAVRFLASRCLTRSSAVAPDFSCCRACSRFVWYCLATKLGKILRCHFRRARLTRSFAVLQTSRAAALTARAPDLFGVA
ncbi:hypothetical protein NDU88_005224 [Pleurodeles waltl]|uniref:Secreted protein n=1 Tax=Pleurodeles waltl TaxID=8319 RepID=A0AAV7RMN9_PLEWA|nr:hypothetical protein NDU88_005224 [Pleurodeles waltl]